MKLRTLSALLFAAVTSNVASAGELFDLYRMALASDARYAIAKARQASASQSVPLAMAGLLPRLSLNGNYGRSLVDNKFKNVLGNSSYQEYAFNPESYSAVLVQPLYRQASLENYWQAEWDVKQADAQLDRNLDELKTRLTQSYLQVQLAAARISLIEQQKKTYAKLRQQAQRSYESGYGTVTEVAESQSRLDELLSEEVTAHAAYANRLTELRNIIGNPRYIPVSRQIPAFIPSLHEGRTLEDWLQLARNNAPSLKEQQARVKGAEYEVSKTKAGYLPTLDLRLQYGHDQDPSYTNINNTTATKSVMLSLNVPLYEGGQTLAQTRRAAADLMAARETERGVYDEMSANIEKEYGNVTALAVRINALRKSVETNELLVRATQKSVGAGVRTNIDVLNAENQLFEARLKLTSSRIDYLQSLVNLRAAAGAVQDEELLKIDDALQSELAKFSGVAPIAKAEN